MKTNIASWAKGLIRVAKSIIRFFALILSALIGTWQPPTWMCWITGKTTAILAKRPKTWAGLAVAALAIGIGVQQWQRWWEMHRPQERQLVVKRELTWTIQAPAVTSWSNGAPTYGSVVVSFNDAAAPLEMIKKVTTDTVVMTPSIPGEWKWTNDRTLLFMPQQDWPAGQEYSLALQKSAFPEEVEISSIESKFRTVDLNVRVEEYKFYTQPDQPEVHQLTATLNANFALTQEALQAQLSLLPFAEKPESFGGATPTFTLTASSAPNKWYFRSARVQVPSKSEEVKLTVAKSLRALSGGTAMAADVVVKAMVPDKYSAMKIANADLRIIKNEQGEPKQFLLVSTSLGVTPVEMNQRVRLYRLTDDDDESLRNTRKSVNDVTPEMVSRATQIPIERVIQDEEPPHPVAHAYQFFSPKPGRLLLRIDSGMQALGGFALADEYRNFLSLPSYPVELEWTGKGNVLALNGEKTIQFKSRGVDYIQITCGRVRSGEVNHMVTQNDYGDFSNPSLEGDFSKDSLVRSQTFIVRVDKKNDWEAFYTPFDLSKAIAHADPSDPDPSRGLFFVQADAVKATLPGEKDTSVHSRVTEPEDYSVYEDGDDGYHNIDEDTGEKICLNSDGTVAKPSDWFSDVKPGGSVIWSGRGLDADRFVMLTDLGLLVKTNADLSRDVFVMSLSAQGPVVGAEVLMISRNGSTLGQSVTDATGRAALPKPTVTAREKQAVAIIVRRGTDLSFIPLRPGHLPAMDYSRYDIDGVLSSRTQAVEAHLFTERGVYRPGDKVHFGGVVKRRDWQAVIEGLPVRAILRDSEGNQIATKDFQLPADGLIEGDVSTAETHPTGVYELSLWVLNRGENSVKFLLGRTPLRVEDFRPDRLKMKVEMEPALAKGWLKPADLKAKISLENLFGAPADSRRVTGDLTLNPADFRFASWPDYEFYDKSRNQSNSIAGKNISLGEVKTSPLGQAEMALNLSNLERVNMSVSMQLEAFESDGGFGVRDHQSFLVSPWDYVAGYDADCQLDYMGKDTAGKVKFIAVDQNLQPLAVEGLRYRITERKYVSVLRKQDNGNLSYQSEARTVLVREENNVRWSAGPVEVNLDTSKVGNFTWQVLNDKEEVICVFTYQVVGKGDEDRSLERDAELTLTVAQPKVQAGEVVEVSIVAPYAGAGLITIEREKVLYSQWFVADTTASVQRVRIPAGLEGTVYCNVSFVRSLDSPDILMSSLSYATQPLTIEPIERQLQVDLTAPKLVKPGETLKVQYRTNHPARIVVYAVDEGIHQITRYKRPQPLDFFFRKQALEVRTQQWFDLLMPEYRFLKQNAAFGGDGGEELEALTLTLNPFKRKRDAPVVWWSGIQVAGPETKELTYTVPDYFTGTLTLMAVAVSETRAGSAQAATLVRTPLVLTLNSPTTVTPGDEFVVSVTLTNLLDKEGPSDVALRMEPSSHLQIIGDAGTTMTVEKSREVTQRFRFKALDSLGSASVKCYASSGSEASTRTETMSIRPATPFRTQVRSAYIRTSKHEQEVTRSLYDAYRRSEVVASPLPVVLALGMRDYMNAYPYDCTEQLTSKGLTLLSYRGMKALPQQGSMTTQSLAQIISELQSRQSNSGGFGYWRGSTSESDDFLNIYASHFLIEAKEEGFAVPHQMITRMNAKLHAICQSGEVSNLAMADRKAYAIYLLTRQGQRPNGLLSLRETLDRTQAKLWQTRLCGSFLAAAYLLQQNNKEAEAIVKTWKLAKADEYRNGEDYWSRVEVDALLSFAIRARHFPDAVKNYGYADWQKLYGVLWQDRYNTVTASCATLGMREFAKVVAANAFEFEIKALPRDGSPAISLVKTKEIFATAPFAEQMKALQFRLDQKDGDQGLFYQVVEEGFDRKLPTAPQKDGIEVYREITTMEGKPIESLTVGDSLKMTLRVRNISNILIGNLVLVDLLPGGFSLEPGGLRPGINTVSGTERADLREDRNLFFFSLYNGKDLTIHYVLRATCAGEFVVPPLYAESMYDRGINGVGLGRSIKVLTRE